MDPRKNKYRSRGGRPRQLPGLMESWNKGSSSNQSHLNPFHPRQHGRKSYKQNDDYGNQYGDYGNSYHSRNRMNFFQNDNFQNNGSSIKDFFFRESNTRLPRSSKPAEESPWSEEAQEQAMKKKLSDVANRLKNKLKSLNADEESESVQNETESESSFSISDHLTLISSDPQKVGVSHLPEEGNKEELGKRTAHVPKPVPPPQPNQPEIRRRSNEQKERLSNESMSTVSKIKDVQRNIQRKVIGELLSMPKTSLQMVLDDPKINPKIELGMSHLVKENRLLLAQKFRNLAESKMTNNEQFRESQFVSDVGMFLDPDLAVDLCKLPPELIKQMGAMFQLDFESDMNRDMNPGFSDDNPIGNSFVNINSSVSDIKDNEESVNVNKPVQNAPAPKYTKYLKKKTEPQCEKSATESVKPLSEILSNLRTTPEKGNERRSDVMQSPAKELGNMIPLPKNQPERGSIQVRDLMELLKVGPSMPMNKFLAPELDKSRLSGTKEDIHLLPKNLTQTFCDNIPLLEKCLESSPMKSDKSVVSDEGEIRSESDADNFNILPWNVHSKLKEKQIVMPKPASSNLRDENKLLIDDQSSVAKSANDGVVITEARITTRKDLFKEEIYSPNSSYNGKAASPVFDYQGWTSEDDLDFEKMNSKDKNQNIKEKTKPLSLAEKLKIMEEMQSTRNKKEGKSSDDVRRKERNLKCKNFLERLEQVGNKTVEFSESPLVEENSNLSDGLLHVQGKLMSDPPVEKIDKHVQVDIQKDEPITLFSLENALANYVKNNNLNLEPLKKVFNTHVKDLHKNCKKITKTDIRFTQTETKEFESVFTQTIKPPEKVFKNSLSQTEIPAKVIKRPAGTQTVLKTDASSCYGVPVPSVPVEETSENLLAEVKMIEEVVHKLNERKFAIFLKLTNLNNGSLSFASEGDLSTTLLHTITNGDTSVWKPILNKEPSKPSERRSHTTTSREKERERERERSSHSHSKRHESAKRPHESKPSEKKDKDRERDRDRDRDKGKEVKEKYDKKKEERRGSDGGKMKTKAELKSVSLSQLGDTKDDLHLKKWLESQDPSKYEAVEDKKEAMSDAGSKRSKIAKSIENKSERSDSENKKKNVKNETSELKNKKKEPEKATKDTKSKKPEKPVEASKKPMKVNDDKSPPAKKQALDKDESRKETKEVTLGENIKESKGVESEICHEPEIQQLVVNLNALERDLNDPQKCIIENSNSAGACIVPQLSQVPDIVDLEDHGEPMEMTSTVDALIGTIQIDENEPENEQNGDEAKTPSRATRARSRSLKSTNDEKNLVQNKRTRNKSEESIIHIPQPLPETPESSNQGPVKPKRIRKRPVGESRKGKKGKAQGRKNKKANTPAPASTEPNLEVSGEHDKETEMLTDSQKPETESPPVVFQIKRKRSVPSSDAGSDSELPLILPQNFTKKRRGSKGQTKKEVPKKFKRVVPNSSSDSEAEEMISEQEKEGTVNVSMLVKDCCVVIKRLTLPINKKDIPDSENKFLNKDESALVEETKVNDVCDNKINEGENSHVVSGSDSTGNEPLEEGVAEERLLEKEAVEEERTMEEKAVEEPAEKEVVLGPEEKEIVAEPSGEEAPEQPRENAAPEQPAEIAAAEGPDAKAVKESQIEKEPAVMEEIPKGKEAAEEKQMEPSSEATDLTPVNNSISVPLPSTTKSDEIVHDDDVLELTVNDSLTEKTNDSLIEKTNDSTAEKTNDSSTENMEVDATYGDSTPSIDNDAFDAPTISDFDLSDHSQALVPNGDSLSRNSEGTPTGGPRKRKINPITFSCHKGVVLDAKIIGKHIFAACEDKLVYCYSIKSGKRKKEYSGHNDAVTCITFLSGKKETTDGFLFTGSLDSQVRSFSIKNSKLVKQSIVLTGQVQCLEENWGIVFAGLKNGVVMKLNSKNLKVINPPLDISQQSVMALKTIMEGPRKVFISATRKEPITIRDANDGLLLRSIDYNFDGTVYSLTIDSNNIYCGTSTTTLLSFDFTDGSLKGQYDCGPGVLSVKLVQHLIFASSYDGKIYVIDSKTKERIGIIPGPGKMLMAMDIYKNKQIVASSNDGKLETWAIPAYIRTLFKKVPNG